MTNRWLQIAHTSGAGLAIAVISAGNLSITARLLGAEGRGELAAATTWALLFGTFGSLSVGQTVLHRTAGRERSEWLPDVSASLLFLIGALSCACFAVAALAFRISHGVLFGNVGATSLTLAFLALPFLMASEHGRFLLYAIDAVSRSNRAQVLGVVATSLSLVLLVFGLRLGVVGALLAALVGSVATTVYSWAPLVGRHLPSGRTAREMLLSGAKLHANAVGSFLFQQGSVLVVNRYRPADEVAFYQFAIQLFMLALLLPNAIGTTAFAQVGELGPDAAWPAQRRLLWQALGLTVLAAAAGYLLAPLAVRIVAGERFLPAAELFRKLLPALLPAAAASVLASQWLGRGLFWQTAALTCGVGVAALGLSIALVPRAGTNGAVWAMLGAYGCSAAASAVFYLWIERSVRARTG